MTTAEAIRNRIIKTELVDIDQLTPFQGKLKTLDDKNFNKLRKSIIEEGFSFTVHVWENGGVTYIIDGHQRVSVLTQMRKQGIKVPPITCAFVSAETYRDAKKLVLLAISQYGKIQKDGFMDFVQGEDFDFGDYDFPQLDFNLDDLFPVASSHDDDDDQKSDQPEDDDDETESDPIDDMPVEVPSRVKSGDIYSLGDHVLVCGDSNNAALVHSVIAEDEADAIVTDPPYGLEFMGKEWDRGVPSKHLWETWISRIKPGAHVLSFSGTRTYHLMTTAIEAAGFEIRDMLQWLYGQGFPKSQDISKAIDKDEGHWRGKAGAVVSNNGAMSGGNYERTDKGDPITPDAKRWSGWGTALKPANEPICLARKPISESTIAKNILKHGTGGLNIDGTRIETTDNLNGGAYSNQGDRDPSSFLLGSTGKEFVQPAGRFPSNVILDEDAAKVLDGQTGDLGNNARKSKGKPGGGSEGMFGVTGSNVSHADSGGASRFFYVAKASKSERNAGMEGMPEQQTTAAGGLTNVGDKFGSIKAKQQNFHPTVKPISLMRYLVKLITPPSGLVLEPFCGSGTTLLACEKEGARCIGFELDPKHCDIILARWEGLTGKKAEKVSDGR